jgi:hypothetical protein
LRDLKHFEKRFPFLIGSYQTLVDLAPKSLKIGRFYLLIINVLAIIFCVSFSKAQITNELAFESLVTNAVKKNGQPIDSISGFYTQELLASISDGKKGGQNLFVEVPILNFERLSKGRFERRLETVVSFRDSTAQSLQLIYQDTLDGKQLSAVRKTTYLELRGQSPRPTAKYLGPALLIGTAIAGIILLFYLRS